MKREIKCFFLMLGLLSVVCPSYAQTLINGRIKSKNTGTPLMDINILIKEKGNASIVGYGQSNENGEYSIHYKGVSDSIELTVTAFNFSPQIKLIPNRSQSLNFELEDNITILKEVKVKSPKISWSEDTLNYMVSRFIDSTDRSIADVLKKMPGIRVQQDGSILYQNKPINKFYIENLDMLLGRYGLATKAISAKDVSTVQVIENHQPIKALIGKEMSEYAAINIKLKESAKGKLIANAQVGIGYSPLLWDNELNGMYFSGKRQSMLVLKNNNTGENVLSRMNSFYSNDASRMKNTVLLSVQEPEFPSIRENRYRFNQSATGSLNDLRKFKETIFTVNLGYYKDEQENNSYAESEYYLAGDSVFRINEKIHSNRKTHSLSSDIQMNLNKKDLYINNLLKLDITRVAQYGLALSDDSITQDLKTPNLGLSNTLNLVRSKGKRTWSFYSFAAYRFSRESLIIHPLLYKELLEQTGKGMLQSVENQQWRCYTTTDVIWKSEKFNQRYYLSVNVEGMDLVSQLSTEPAQKQIPDSLRNSLNQIRPEFKLASEYNIFLSKRFFLKIVFPISYFVPLTYDRVRNRNSKDPSVYFTPSFMLEYRRNAYWNTKISYNSNMRLGDIQNEFTSWILQSYRNVFRNEGDVFRQFTHSLAWVQEYRNPLKEWFTQFFVNYSHSKANLLYSFRQSGVLRSRSSFQQTNSTERLESGLIMDKGIDLLNTKLFFLTKYSIYTGVDMIESKTTNYRSEVFSISPRIWTNPLKSVGVEWNLNGNINMLSTENSKFKDIYMLSQNLRFNFTTPKYWSMSLSLEHFHNSAIEEGSRNMLFTDFNVRYRIKKIECCLNFSNIFNTKKYVSASFNGTNRYYTEYYLRPAEIVLQINWQLK